MYFYSRNIRNLKLEVEDLQAQWQLYYKIWFWDATKRRVFLLEVINPLLLHFLGL